MSLTIRPKVSDFTDIKLYISNMDENTFYHIKNLKTIENDLLHYDDDKSNIKVYFHTEK